MKSTTAYITVTNLIKGKPTRKNSDVVSHFVLVPRIFSTTVHHTSSTSPMPINRSKKPMFFDFTLNRVKNKIL